MQDELRGVKLRLERAHEHIDALKHESRMFMAELPEPYGWSIETDPESGDYIIRARVIRTPPVRLGILAADAAHTLRAALDMIAWEVARAGTNPPADGDTQTSFPICTKPELWESRATKRMLAHIDDEPKEVIRSFQPCYRPTYPPRLQVLQAIDNWAKHKAVPDLMSFYVGVIRPLTAFQLISFNAHAFDDGDEMARARWVGPSTGVDKRFRAQILCHVGFSKGGPGFGWPIDFLEGAHREISEEILPAFYPFVGSE
jgi:hypothetical protein